MPTCRILLAEDDPDIPELFAPVLREEGFDVDIARTAAETLDLLSSSHYAVTIIDWWLPDGDGVVLANRAADLGAQSFVLSGYALRLVGAAADRLELLRKPITPTELVEAIRRKIGAAAERQDLR